MPLNNNMVLEKLDITCIQPDIRWEDREANLGHLGEMVRRGKIHTGLVILPEMFSTGFTMQPEKFAETGASDLEWMKQWSAACHCVMVGSYIAREGNKFVNRLAFVPPDADPAFYDKRHLFRMGGEHEHYLAGEQPLIISWKGWTIKSFICYDLRFPVWIRQGPVADLLLFIANWPSSRKEVWLTLLQARAIENQAYVVGVNRVGTDGRNIYYQGDTVVIDPRGQVMAMATPEKEEVLTVTLDKPSLDLFREKFPVHLDADRFYIFT